MQSHPDPSALRRTSLPLWIGIALAPFLLTVVVLTALYRTVGLEPVPRTPTGVYAIASVLVVALVAGRLSSTARTEILPLRAPGLAELVAAILAAAGTIFVFDPVATAVASVFGESGAVGSFESPLGAIVFAASSVAIAPVTEEALFRGLTLDAIRVRYGVVVAVLGSSLLFGGIHLVIGGVSGTVSALLSGLVYAGLRVRYENLAGAVIAHALNNAYWVLVMTGVIPNLVPG